MLAPNPARATDQIPTMPRPCSVAARRCAAALAAVAGLAGPALAQNWHWNATSGHWSDAGSWLPLGLPAPSAMVFIGSSAAAENATVTLDLTTSIASLVLTDGMTLNTDHRYLAVGGDTVVSGHNLVGPVLYRSRLRVGPRDGLSFMTRHLTLSDRGELRLEAGVARVNSVMSISEGSVMDGDGIITFTGPGSTLVNDGLLGVGTSGGLILQQIGGGRYDLDGAAGLGVVHMTKFNVATGQGARLRLEGAGLSDTFSGELRLAADSDLLMNLTEGWTADANSQIRMFGMSEAPGLPGRIRGGAFRFGGLMRVSGFDGEAGQLEIESSNITLRSQARVELIPGARLTLGGPATSEVLIEGGTYEVGEGAVVRFPSPTEVRGGAFTTTSLFPSGGRVEFNGPTVWNGEVDFNGYSRQSGDATVAGPSTINAGRFVMAETEQTTWGINSPLTINAQSIGTTPGNGVHGTLNIAGGWLGRLTVNLPGPQDYWVINGRVNLTGDATLHVTRLAGSEFHSVGALAVTGGRAQVTSDAWLLGGTVDIGPEDASLRMMGRTRVSWLAEFEGQGMLRNGLTGHMTLSLGADLNEVGLTNEGLLEIGATGAAAASVDRFTCTDSATWAIDIGGYLAETEHDQLTVSGGPALLAGLLEVRLIDEGDGLFLPQIGDEFTILTALGLVSGSFAGDPVSYAGSMTYEWSVQYRPHSVVLRLDNIVPAPGGPALLGLAGLIARRRRRI